PGEFSTKNCGLVALVPTGLPALTVLIATGWLVPGALAMFVPLRKKAKTSLNWLLTNSLYSSEPKTYLKRRRLPSGTKSNSRILALNVCPPDRAVNWGSPAAPLSVPALSALFGPITNLASPVVRTMPEGGPMIPDPPAKVPAAIGTPVYLMLDTC